VTLNGGRSVDSIKRKLSSTPQVDGATKCLSIIALSLIISLILSVAIIIYYPFQVLDIVEPIPVEYKMIHVGESQKIQFHYYKYTSVTPDVTRSLINIDTNTVVRTVQLVTNKRPKGEGDFSLLFSIPVHKDAIGHCKITLTYRYAMFGFRPIYRHFETEPFLVINGVIP